MKNKKRTKVCHLTSVHSDEDTRIFHKECKSLAKEYEIHLIAKGETDGTIDGVRIHGVHINTGSRFMRMTKGVYMIMQRAIKIDADIYHFHDPELMPVGLYLKWQGKKVVYDVHEDYPAAILSKYWIIKPLRRIISWSFDYFEKYVCSKMDAVVSVHEDIALRLRKRSKKIVILCNYPVIFPLKIHEKQKSFVWLGGVSDIRGRVQLIKSFEQENILLNVIGKVSGEKKSLKNIIWHGAYPLDIALQKASENFVGLLTYLPEPNHINALPNKLFEYMYLGIAVIASDFPKWRKIIEDSQCGMVVDPLNVSSIKKGIRWMAEHYDEAMVMGKNGRKAIEQKYNWSIEEKKLLAVYKEILAK